jgi:hypothetical protein
MSQRRDGLGDGLPVRGADFAQGRVYERVVAAFGERARDSICTPHPAMSCWSAPR